jgi:plastocyanin
LFRKSSLTLVGAVTLLLLAVAPVYGAPSLSLGSAAAYNLTGRLQATQSCTAEPIAYSSQACLGVSAATTAFVTITDNGSCPISVGSDPFAGIACRFIPLDVTVNQGSKVVWTNLGNVTHTVTANLTANVGLPRFDSGPIKPHGGTYVLTFNQTGIYHYYDSVYGLLLIMMRGIVNVTPQLPPPPPPRPTSFQFDLVGTVGWNAEGLSTSQANLNVSHRISLSVSPFPGISFTPVTESGSFEQSINLSTRVESPSTATSIVRSISTSLLSALAGTTLTTGVTGPVFQNMLSVHSNGPDYTMWWVNGPLSLGSPVQILQGWSSVTGSESLNLGANIGTRSAWIITSQLAQTISLSIPNPNNPLSSTTSSAVVSLKLLWSYDKSADLLLRNDNAASLTLRSVTPTTVGTATGSVAVTVTRNMALTIDVALLLASTNLGLSKSPSHSSTLMDLLSAMPWMPLGLAGLAAGVAVAAVVWFTRRAKSVTVPGPSPTPASSPATPS